MGTQIGMIGRVRIWTWLDLANFKSCVPSVESDACLADEERKALKGEVTAQDAKPGVNDC